MGPSPQQYLINLEVQSPFCLIRTNDLVGLKQFAEKESCGRYPLSGNDRVLGLFPTWKVNSLTPLEYACGRWETEYQQIYNPRAALILLEAGADARGRPGVPSPLELARKHSTGTPDDLALIQALIDRGGEQTRP